LFHHFFGTPSSRLGSEGYTITGVADGFNPARFCRLWRGVATPAGHCFPLESLASRPSLLKKQARMPAPQRPSGSRPASARRIELA
jgi:hypothetical protein